MVCRLNWTMRGERGRESKRGAANQEVAWTKENLPGLARLYRDQAGGKEVESQSLGGRGLEKDTE